MHPPTETERQDIVRTIFSQNLASQASSTRFQAYFNHYCSAVCPASSGDAVVDLDTPALKTHADILGCVEAIIQDPNITFNQFVAKVIEPKATDASPREKDHIANVAAKVAFAVNCTLRDYYSDYLLDSNSHRVKWEEDIPFLHFMENAFKGLQGVEEPGAKTLTSKTSLKAWKLSKRYGIKIRATDNLLEHLVLDPKTLTLKVFHHVSFLRAHLVKSKDELLDLNFEQSLRIGTLPPKLLLETLLTFHDVLFPVASVRDKRSRATLELMIQKRGFDTEGRWIEFVRATPADMKFEYWGARLSTLEAIVKRPPPKNSMVAWLERHTSERNALTVAIVGLFLSALFALLSFIVGLLQLILAWVAYKKNQSGST